ncbi:MAG TPA: hypothetical protein EYP59_01680, partial [Thiotrichaceae bacterium]|nr:hypothetical protein [Thiotrichaceae bacterium]
MSFNTLISTALSTLLKEGTIVEILLEKAGEKAIAIFQAHFTFSAFEIANSYQNSYTYALAAICTGLATPEQKMRFLQKWTHSKIEREFADQIEQLYFQPFALQCGVQTEAEQRRLRCQLIDNIKKLTHFPPIFSEEKRDLTESELAAFIHYQGTLAITDLILKHNHTLPYYQAVRDETVEAFFRFEELLGNATLFFLHEIFRTDERAKATIAALQREALWLDVRDIKTTQEKLLTRLEEEKEEQNAKAMQALQGGYFAQAAQLSSHLESLQKDINKLPDTLEAAQAAWQNTHQHWVAFAERFHSWGGVLNAQLSEVLAETQTLHGEIEAVHDDVKANLAKSEEMAEELKALKQLMANLMARFDLSAQLKPSDEFTHHNSSSLKQIQAAIAKLSVLPSHHPNYNQVVIMGGSLLSSTGDMAAAEKLFLQAFNQAAPDSADKALASFNLFLVRLVRQDYDHALVDLQTAIDCERRYALHDVEKYPMVRLLGAGGMGCVFLCHDQWGEKQVVVKCFWEGRKGTRQAVFGEAMIMRQVAGAYVPAPLDCGYVDAHRQERPYFVSEYIEGAVDGENWLAQYGAFDISTGIAVGIEIAKGLKVAHEKGIYHLDLKPANLLFKRTATGLRVKIIDFGLARVATSLRQEAMSRRTTAGMTQFGQAIVGTILYAAPEQMGEVEYGKPGAKSDLYALGATLYRLMTNESPRTLNPRRLSDAPPALFDLLCHCKEENPAQRPDSAAEVLKRLETILTAITIIVSPTGDCQSISAAIKKAKAGDRILVKPGVYQEDLVIDKPLEIIGEGDVKEIVVESQNAECISMKTDHALVRGLRLHNRAEKRFTVNIPQGQLTLEYCDITSDSLICIGIHGSEAEGIVRHCKIHDSKEGCGVYVYENGTGQIENCDIFGNGVGILILEGGNPTIQHCQIHDSKEGIGVGVGV